MRYSFIPSLSCTLLFSFIQSAHGQKQLLPTAAVAPIHQYNQALTIPASLYSGPEYIDYARRYFTQSGHQYFLSTEKQIGSIYYNDHLFSNIQLQYDAVLEHIIITHPTSPLTLRLVNEYVNYFTIGNHYFTRIIADSISKKTITTGYYELCIEGSATLLAKRAKHLREEFQYSRVNAEFNDENKFYIKKDTTYYRITSKSTLLRSLPDRNKEIQKYLREHKLKFRSKYINESLIEIIRYYNSLKSTPSI